VTVGETRNTPTVIPPSNIPEKTPPHVAARVAELNEEDRKAAAARRIAELTGQVAVGAPGTEPHDTGADPGAGKTTPAPGDEPPMTDERYDETFGDGFDDPEGAIEQEVTGSNEELGPILDDLRDAARKPTEDEWRDLGRAEQWAPLDSTAEEDAESAPEPTYEDRVQALTHATSIVGRHGRAVHELVYVAEWLLLGSNDDE
jgi:hypothetical protein